MSEAFMVLFSHLEEALKSVAIEDCPALLGEIEKIRAQAWVKLTAPPTVSKSTGSHEPVKYLTVAEVAKRFHVEPTWLYRHKKKMPHSQPSRKLLLFPEAAIERWFASRKAI